MIIYIEKQAKTYKQSKIILQKFVSATVVEIDNYKNLFSKNISYYKRKDVFIIAKLPTSSILDAPD